MSATSKFGVQVAGAGGVLQPKLPYRFRVRFYGFGLDGTSTNKLEQNVEKCSRPKFKQEEVVVHSYNSRVYFGGKTEWEAINVTVRDDITNGSISVIGEQIQKQFNFFEQISAISGSDYKFRMEIETLDGTHAESLETWNLEGCWITNVTYPEGVYTETNKYQSIDMVIRFDNATHLAGANGNVVTDGGQPFPDDVFPSAGNLGSTFGGFLS